jgi:predicted dehydrogenase
MGHMMGAVTRWGILGPGSIASSFARDLAHVDGAQLVAVGSRDRERAVAFASSRAIPYAYGSYEALVNDPNVDIVYIATPHHRHVEDALLCLRAGKHVLVEKPFAVSSAGATELATAASASGRFLMEALWTRFFPLFEKARELIISGRIGSVVELRADFGHAAPYDADHRIWNPALAGGALLDLGVYPLTWAVELLGWPESVEADSSLAASGVDEATGMRLHHQGGAESLLVVSQRRHTPTHVVIQGTEGRLTVTAPMYAPRRLVLSRSGGSKPSRWNRRLSDLDQPGSPLLGSVDRLPASVVRVWGSGPARQLRNRVTEQISTSPEPLIDLSPGLGYRYEAAECGRALSAGQVESSMWPVATSVRMTELIEKIALASGAARSDIR